MDLHDSPADAAFRHEVRTWLNQHLVGAFAAARGIGGPGREHQGLSVRQAWEQELAGSGWTCIGWPPSAGGRGASVAQQVIFHEEYARSGAPARVSILGEGLLGPTLIAYGTEAQKRRFLEPIRLGRELWCQGYSEPDAGSDLANVQTRAERRGDQWVITGQKVWTSLAQWADWCFVLCRTEAGSGRHRGLSYLLVPMDQPGVEIRPITQLTGTSEFNEVFFDGARTDADLVVGEAGDGWRIALATLAFERGVGLLGHLVHFRRELDRLLAHARRNGRRADPVVRQRLAAAWIRLEVFRLNSLRSLSGIDGPVASPQASIGKLFWGTWHRDLGELAVDVAGLAAVAGDWAVTDHVDEPDGVGGYPLTELQRSFLFSRADTIYGGSNQIQRTIIGERVLGLPAEPKPAR